ncbi:MAG: ankyrin repeat domain-containing protein [Candidatus Moranbacteria bacterium]|nr:ankyrin repeat domain-containing protein [Candidatus Moranbacteria bacterium]
MEQQQETQDKLFTAIEKGTLTQQNLFVLTFLGADPNAKTSDGWTVLHWAPENGNEGMADLLLQHGARK